MASSVEGESVSELVWRFSWINETTFFKIEFVCYRNRMLDFFVLRNRKFFFSVGSVFFFCLNVVSEFNVILCISIARGIINQRSTPYGEKNIYGALTETIYGYWHGNKLRLEFGLIDPLGIKTQLGSLVTGLRNSASIISHLVAVCCFFRKTLLTDFPFKKSLINRGMIAPLAISFLF
jgi:hypothetical protein